MKLSELMAGVEPDPMFEGIVTNDDWVLAIDIKNSPEDYANYVVAQLGATGVDAQINVTTQDKIYIREGTVTTKTGAQRTFAVSGDRYIGDEFQDFCCGLDVMFGTGQGVVVSYVRFCIRTGKGEKGTASIMVNSDGGGNAGESSTISIDIKGTKAAPTEYTYSAGVNSPSESSIVGSGN